MIAFGVPVAIVAQAPAQPATVPATAPAVGPAAGIDRELEEALGGDAKVLKGRVVPVMVDPGPVGGPPGPADDGGVTTSPLMPWPTGQGGGGGDSGNPDLSFILDVAAAMFDTERGRQLGAHDPTEAGFNLQQLELSIGSAVDPFSRFDGNLVFSPFGVEIEEAYATTTALGSGLQLRAGQFLTRFGRANATHPHTWDFVDQPLWMGKFFGGEGNRGLGAEGSVLLPLPWYVEAVGSLTDARGASTNRSFLGTRLAPPRTPLDLLATGAVKQFFPLSRDWSLSAGISGATGPSALGARDRADLFGTDLYLRYRPLEAGDPTVVTVLLEGARRRRQGPGLLLEDTGWNLSAVWRFDFRWGVGLRHEEVSGLPGDPLDPAWLDMRRRTSAQITFWPSEFSRIRGQVSRDEGAGQAVGHAAMLAIETVIGAHGSHAF
ncbi:MAG: zinc-regulated TonB-dependent outer membrane receptor [Candidatus Sericytochromatia bacterium]|nr:zinc-regulated TonB-dependent outer membrane receptor [Candidatus Tanganyikabacteria bacterium]